MKPPRASAPATRKASADQSTVRKRASPQPPVPAPSEGSAHRIRHALLRWLELLVVTAVLLQTVWILQIVALRWLGEPPSTAFQRTAIWQLLRAEKPAPWQHQPVPAAAISPHIQRAVIAAEDNFFLQHHGMDWEAMRRAWQRNAQGQRMLGGSTITQQLAKNLYLSGERTLWRKGQELLLAAMLENLLSKEHILAIYLNQVEWGLGIYGIEAASQHYFGRSAAQLTTEQAARLAVMLPQPRRLGQEPYSPYMQQRTRTIQARMRSITLPESP